MQTWVQTWASSLLCVGCSAAAEGVRSARSDATLTSRRKAIDPPFRAGMQRQRSSGGLAMAVAESTIHKTLPFDADRLDSLLDEAGIDVLIATSKHNVQYLLGGYRFFFFETMDAIGTTRYLPALVYRKGKPESAAYVGCAMETFEQELGRLWPTSLDLRFTGTVAAMEQAVAHIRRLGDGIRRIGVESAFLPADAEGVLRRELSNCEIVDAVFPLERLRARKSPEE